MKRNSNKIFLESPYGVPKPTITPLPWVNDAPDFSGFNKPTLLVLQKAWDDFVASGEELEIVPDPEPPLPGPNWTAFNSTFSSDPDWIALAGSRPTDPTWYQMLVPGIVSTAANGNAGGLQSAYDLALDYLTLQGVTIDPAIQAGWQSIADLYAIPVTF